MKNGVINDNLFMTFDKYPNILDFLQELSLTQFLHNVVYSELIYSILEFMIYSSLPYSQSIIKFLQKIVNKPFMDLTWQELKLICEVSKNEVLMEELVILPGVKSLESTPPQSSGNMKSESIQGSPGSSKKSGEKNLIESYYSNMINGTNAGYIYLIYLLSYPSFKNLSILEKHINIIDLAKKINELDLNSEQQYFIVCIFFNLLLKISGQSEILPQFLNNSSDLYLTLFTPAKGKKDLDLVSKIREEIRNGFNIKYSSGFQQSCVLSLNVKYTKLVNMFVLLLLDSSADCQTKVK